MLITKAEQLARQLHANQVDKAGKPYIEHLQAVVKGVLNQPDEYIAVAWLHDSLEDTPITFDELNAQFGDSIAHAILAITKQKNEKYEDYLLRVKNNPISRAVKLSDLTHNMDLSRLTNISEKDLLRQEKYQKAKEILTTK